MKNRSQFIKWVKRQYGHIIARDCRALLPKSKKVNTNRALSVLNQALEKRQAPYSEAPMIGPTLVSFHLDRTRTIRR